MSMILSGDGTITGLAVGGLPNATIVQAELASGVAGNGPAFRAYATGGQSISNLVFTKVQYNNKAFDTANCFDATTNYRFTPNVAGYYQINGVLAFNGAALGYATLIISKNGVTNNQGAATPNNTTFGGGCNVSDIIYMNGTTDYIEFTAAQSSGGALTVQSSSWTNVVSGFLARAA